MSLLDTVRALCKERNIAVSKLEDEAGLSRGTVGRWDASMPSIDKVQKVAAYFGVTTSDLLGEDTKKDPAQSAESKIDIQFRQETSDLTDAEWADVMEYIRFKKSQRGK